MGRALWIPDTLRSFGVPVVEYPGWQTRGSDDFHPRGVVCHHTASAPGSDAPSLGTCVNGRSDLPGPLCQVLLTRSGTAVVVASGRANHAGRGGYRGLSGNTSVLGIEAEYAGIVEREPDWSAPLREVFPVVAAALLSGIRRDADWCCGHREWAPGRKIDPTGIDMTSFRRQVAGILAGDVASPAAAGPAPARLLRRGDKGADVAMWQEALNRTGAGLVVDGDFGPATERATLTFQARSGLSADGIVGPLTRDAMTRQLTPVG
jgi:hypothetical protein